MDNTKTIVFDLDDTLVYEIEYLKSAFNEIALKVDASNKDLYNQMFDWYTNKENVFQKVNQLYPTFEIEDMKKTYRNHYPNFNPHSQNRTLLLELKKQGHFIGLITDGYSTTQRNKIKALNIETLFDLIIISEEFGSEKPNSKNYEIFNQFCTNDYFYVGDNVSKDFVTPNKLGWNTICLLNKGENIHSQDFNKEYIYLPKHKIKDLSEILKLTK